MIVRANVFDSTAHHRFSWYHLLTTLNNKHHRSLQIKCSYYELVFVKTRRRHQKLKIKLSDDGDKHERVFQIIFLNDY